MNSKSLLVGGLLPTVMLGLGTVLCIGLLTTLVGGGWVSSPRAQLFAMLMGLAWATAIGSMAYAVSTLGVPVSIVAPLTNANALVALAASALVFREWGTLNGPRVLAGAAFIVFGAIVVATAKD